MRKSTGTWAENKLERIATQKTKGEQRRYLSFWANSAQKLFVAQSSCLLAFGTACRR